MTDQQKLPVIEMRNRRYAGAAPEKVARALLKHSPKRDKDGKPA